MSNKTKGAKFALSIMTIAVLCAACVSTPKAQSTTAASNDLTIEEGKAFAAWKGEWVSVSSIKADPALEDSYKMAADSMPYYTVDGVKAAVAESYGSPVLKAKFDGTNTAILTVKTKEGKEVEMACEYKYMGKVPMPNNNDYVWETFEAVKDSRELRNAKYFIALAPRTQESGITYWQGRFSGYSINWLVNGETGFPTYLPATTAQADMITYFKGCINEQAKTLPKAPFASYAAHNKWVNRPFVYDDTSKEVADVYDKLIKEFAGKNPTGGDFTKADIITEMKKGDDSTNDFSHMEFITTDGKNELVIYQGDKEIVHASYKRVAASASRPYITMMADKNVGKFSLISFVVVHGAPNYHFHLWYGANEEELSQLKGTPTCYKVDVAKNLRADYIEKGCRKVLQALTEKK
ncbi:MAG: ZinT/AdcA family metal-binding protein [Treponema sp.]